MPKPKPCGPRQANLVLIAYASSKGSGSESRGTFRQKARSLAPLNGWACAVKICHDGMLEDTNSLDGAHVIMNHVVKRFMILVHLCRIMTNLLMPYGKRKTQISLHIRTV